MSEAKFWGWGEPDRFVVFMSEPKGEGSTLTLLIMLKGQGLGDLVAGQARLSTVANNFV